MVPRVLIMETDGLSRGSLGSWLRRHGCQVHQADHQMEARRILQEQSVDVVLIGLNDYGTESLSIIRCLRESSDDAAFILLTKLQDMRLSIEGMKLGAFDALPVPVDVDLLLERIFAACSGRKKAPERRLKIVGKIDGRRPKSLRSFMDAVGLKKARAWLGTARLS